MIRYRTLSAALAGTTALVGAAVLMPMLSPAYAACSSTNPVAGETVTCSDSDTAGVQGAVGVADVTVNVEEGATITRGPGNVNAIRGQGDNWSVTNDGAITSTWRGVVIESGSAANTATGTIEAQDYAIQIRQSSGDDVVTNDGTLTSAGRHAVVIGGGGSVVNTGTITGAFTTDTAVNYGGVYIGDGGNVTNSEGATIEGAYGVILFGESQVDNAGTISGASQIGVQLTSGGTVNNSGEIDGATFGVWARDGAADIVNSGTIISNGEAIYLGNGGSVENQSGGLISGRIGVSMVGDGTVTNAENATIRGRSFAVSFDGGEGSVANAGSIISDATYGVQLAAGGSVDNLGTGTITGGNFGVWVDGGSGAVTNTGAIAGNSTHGVVLFEGGSVSNLGGGTIDGASLGVYIDGGGVVTNAAGGRIEGQNFGGVVLLGESEVSNAGAIIGNGNSAPTSAGVQMNDGGVLANAATGSITGSGYGVFVGGGGSANVSNAGAIAGGGIDGVRLNLGGTVDNQSGGTIEGARYGVSLYGEGTVTNNGSITGGDRAVFFDAGSFASTLVNTGSLIGGVQMSDGDATLAIATGSTISGPVDAGGGSGDKVLRLFGAGTDSYDGSFTGFTSLEIDSSQGGTWTLVGDQFFADGTTVSDGSLIVNNSLLNDIFVESGGILGGAGTVGTTVVASGGTIAPGNSIGTLNVAGDLTFQPGSIYEVEVEPGGTASDLIAVTGTAFLNGGSVVHIGLTGTYDPTATYTILTADGGIDGEFDDVASNFAFLDPTLGYGANDITLTLDRNDVGFDQVGVTRNQIATAGGVESLGFGNAVFDAVVQLDEASARFAFDQLSGEIHASANTALIEDSRHIRNAANDRIRAAFGNVAAAPLPVLSYGPDGSLDKAPGVAPEYAATPTDYGTAAWGTVFGSWGSTDGNGNAAELDRSTGGLIAGLDGMLGTWRVGALAGYSQSSFDVDERSSSGDADNYHLGVYGGTQWGAIGFRTGLAYTWSDIETHRSVAFPGFTDSLSADYDAGTFQAFGELGYAIDTEIARFEPFVNLAHVNVRRDGFTETGGAAAFSSGRSTTDTTFTTLGVRASTDFAVGDMTATARGMIGWRHAFGDTTPLSTHAFAGGDAFTIAGAPIAKDAAVVEAGLDFTITPAATLGVSYQGQFGSGSSDHGGRIGLDVKF